MLASAHVSTHSPPFASASEPHSYSHIRSLSPTSSLQLKSSPLDSTGTVTASGSATRTDTNSMSAESHTAAKTPSTSSASSKYGTVSLSVSESSSSGASGKGFGVLESPWSFPLSSLFQHLAMSPSSGLDASDVVLHRALYGVNHLPQKSLSFFQVFVSELSEPLILMLVVVAVLYLLWGSWTDSLAALLIIFSAVLLEIFTEYRAKNAVAAVSTVLHHPPVSVLRGGRLQSVKSEELVVGDVFYIQAGAIVPADGRIITSFGLSVNESVFTGEVESISKAAAESLPHSSFPLPLSGQLPLSARSNMIHSGSTVTHGFACAVATAVGTKTESGQIFLRSKLTKPPQTFMQKQLKTLAAKLTTAAIACCLAFGAGLYFASSLSLSQILLFVLSLAFAVIPEELPILIKAVMAVGALKLSSAGVVVKSLKAAEAMGSVSVVCTDKTGTLTTNALSFRSVTLGKKSIQLPHIDSTSDMSTTAISHEDLMHSMSLLEHWLLSSPALHPVASVLETSADLLHRSKKRPSATHTADQAKPNNNTRTHLHPAASAAASTTHQSTAASSSSSLAPSPFSSVASHFSSPSPVPERIPSPLSAAAVAVTHRIVEEGLKAVHDQYDRAVLSHFLFSACHASNANSSSVRRLNAAFSAVLEKGATWELVKALPFDSFRRRSSCIRRSPTNPFDYRISLRGAVESVLAVCSHAVFADGVLKRLDSALQQEIMLEVRKLEDEGERLLAFAVRRVEEAELQKDMMNEEKERKARKLSSARLTANGNQSASYSPVAESADSVCVVPGGLSPDCITLFEKNLTLIGFLGFVDPVRPSASATVSALQHSGIRVQMVTGDCRGIALSVAKKVGILQSQSVETDDKAGHVQHNPVASSVVDFPIDDSTSVSVPLIGDSSSSSSSTRSTSACVYARMSPTDKLSLIHSHQQGGECVLMLGDGFNDGPALAAADVGVSMGSGGTDLARASAGIILLENDFTGVVMAIAQGRRVIDNLFKSIRFYLSCKLAFLLLFFVPLVFLQPMPLLPLHVILLESFMDLGASTGFTLEAAGGNVMDLTPKAWKQRISVSWTFLTQAVFAGLAIYGVVEINFFLLLNAPLVNATPEDQQNFDSLAFARSATFVSWLIAHVLMANAVRCLDRSLLFDAIFSSPTPSPAAHLPRLAAATTGAEVIAAVTSPQHLLSNLAMNVWSAGAILFGIASVSLAPLRSLLSLTSLSYSVLLPLRLPIGTGTLEMNGLLFVIGWPVLVFVFAEFIKFLVSTCRRTAQ